MCKYKFQEFFLKKTQYQEYCLIECFETSRKFHEKKINNKKNKIKQITLKNDGYLDVQNINKKKIMNLALLVI